MIRVDGSRKQRILKLKFLRNLLKSISKLIIKNSGGLSSECILTDRERSF